MPDCHVEPSILYSKLAPIGELTSIVPVIAAQVGCWVTEAIGANGAPGTALTVTVLPDVSQVVSTVLLTTTV